MKIMQRRALSLLLTAAMIISILPTAVLAQLAEPNSSWVDEKIREINDALPEGQKYTKNSWYRLGNTDLYRLSLTRLIDGPDGTITDTIVFIAPGEGAGKDNSSIPDYQNATSDRPWRDANPSAVYIADGVTGVGAHAFDTITTIQTLEIENPSSLTYVGAFAFNGCDNLSFTADDPLDLSSVINMGENAFNGCSRLRNVKLGEGLTEIPKNAFNSCGLTSIEIPVGVKTIGANAFSNNSFREQNGETLILPEGLEAIGDNAFFILPNDTTAAGGFKTLVIPYTVSSIGSGAFSGHRKLSSVTIQDEINGGNGPSQLEYLGSAAFGKDTYTAYSETRTIVDEINPDITYTGLTGADFYLPNDKDIQELFINGDTCYTGNISPLIYDGTVEPTCEEDGYHIYKQTVPNTSIAGQTVEMTLHVRIEALGHEWELAKEYGPSCEDDSYKLLICKNDPTHMQKTDTGYNGVKTDHDYKLKEIVGYKLGEGSITITYECQKDTHDNDRDSCDKILNIVIDVAALSGTTAQVIGDLQLPHLSNGTLEWADDVDLEEELTESTEYLHVKFTPDEVDYADYTGVTGTAIDGDNSGELLIKVDVTKAKLDFSRVAFNNVRNFIVPNSYEYRYITVDKIGLPDDVTYDSPLYYDDTGYSDNKPRYSLAHEWNGTVQVTFEYNPEKYVVDTGKRPPAGYEFDTSVSGKVVISHSYDIIAQSMDLLAAKAIQGLVYSGTPQPTVRLSDVPYESTISWTWEATEGSGNGSGEAVSPSNSNTIEVAGITEAGTYNVKITVTKDGYETKELEAIQVTIDKCTIVTPAAATGLQYTGQEQIGVVTAPNAEDKYTITGNVNVNAGTYTAKASLSDKDNYKWSTTDSSEDVDIVWSIAKRRIVETNIDGAYSYPVPYTGQEQQAVKLPSSPSGFFEVSYENGTLIGKYDSDGDKIFDTVAFTISNSKRTNAGSYPVYAKVTDFENFCWAGHADSEEYFMGTWVISTKQVNAPALSAEDAVYDGNPYDEEVSLIHSSASGSNASSHGIIAGVDKLSYYTQSAGGTALNEVPTNAGTYYVEAEWEYEPGLFADNYLILGATRKQFTIEKKELALTAPTEGLNVQYTGTEYTVPAPDVRGLVKDGDEYSIVYTYKYTPLDGEEGSEQYSAGALKVTMAGTYKIIAQIAENCVNYKSEPSEEYVFRIGSSSQTVKLEDEEGNPIQDQSTITKILGEEEFTISGKGYVGDSDIESGCCDKL